LELGCGQLYVGSQPESGQEPYGAVRQVKLPPGQPVGGGTEERMVVVVPSFPIGKQGDPPVVGRPVLRGPEPVSPGVGGGIDEPGAVPHEDRSEEDSPEDKRPTAPRIQENAQKGLVDAVGGVEEPVNRVLGQVRSVNLIPVVDIQLFVESKQPPHVGPPESFGGAVRVVGLVGSSMVETVDGDPFDRAVLISQTAAEGQ